MSDVGYVGREKDTVDVIGGGGGVGMSWIPDPILTSLKSFSKTIWIFAFLSFVISSLLLLKSLNC